MNTLAKSLYWYEFDQNNSGGYFNRDSFFGDVVFIQATSADEANKIFEDAGAYDQGWCDCCGERWYPVRSLDGHKEPTRYGKPVSEGVDLYSPEGYIMFHGYNGKTLKWDGKKDFYEVFKLESVSD